ncbi:hypothetical protein VUR80DRAFT_401 [Thermomyces stellatus]
MVARPAQRPVNKTKIKGARKAWKAKTPRAAQRRLRLGPQFHRRRQLQGQLTSAGSQQWRHRHLRDHGPDRGRTLCIHKPRVPRLEIFMRAEKHLPTSRPLLRRIKRRLGAFSSQFDDRPVWAVTTETKTKQYRRVCAKLACVAASNIGPSHESHFFTANQGGRFRRVHEEHPC